MNLTELASPIRIYWDIGPARDAPVNGHQRTAEEIALNKILSLQLTENAPRLSEAVISIIDSLAVKPVALSLVASRSALDASTLEHLRLRSVKVVFMQASSLKDLEAVPAVVRKSAGRPAMGVSFSVARENVSDLPGVLAFCVNHRIEHLLLPMQRLTTGSGCFSFSREERTELTKRLSRIEKPSGLKITIHDPFLWRACYPTVEFPNGGCQAANTMLYISPGFDVYPCPLLPIKIGNLREKALKDIIRSEQKMRLRRDILKRPAACVSCGETNECKGGCRGRAFVMTGSLEQPDPACK
jgi:GeoRSP system SPASM domain protein